MSSKFGMMVFPFPLFTIFCMAFLMFVAADCRCVVWILRFKMDPMMVVSYVLKMCFRIEDCVERRACVTSYPKIGS